MTKIYNRLFTRMTIGNHTNLSILLAEDHPDTARVTQLLLEREGMTVRIAGNIAEALQLAENQPFDLLIADMRLPDGDGFKLNHALRERHAIKSICLSGEHVEPDPARDPLDEFSAYLTKPMDIPNLLRTIRQVAAPH